MYEINYEILPNSLREGMRRYVVDRIETGDFLRAVLENDLSEAWRRADPNNRLDMGRIVEFLYELPPACWGSKANVKSWLKKEGYCKMLKVDKKVKLELVGLDDNAFSLLGAFRQAARNQGWSTEEIQSVRDECLSGDYDHLLQTLMAVCE